MKAVDIKVCSSPTTICNRSRSEQIIKKASRRRELRTKNRIARSDVLYLKNNKTNVAQSINSNASVKPIRPLGEKYNQNNAGIILKVFDTGIRQKLFSHKYNVLSKKYYKNKIKKCFDQYNTSRLIKKFNKINFEKNKSKNAIRSEKSSDKNVQINLEYSVSNKNTNDEDKLNEIINIDIPNKVDDNKDDIEIEDAMIIKLNDNKNQKCEVSTNSSNNTNCTKLKIGETTLQEKTLLDDQNNIFQNFTENKQDLERANLNNIEFNLISKPNDCKPLMIQDVFYIVTKDFKKKFCKMTALKDFDAKHNLYFYDQSVYYKCIMTKCIDQTNITFRNIDIIQTITLDLVKELLKCCKSKNKNINITTNLIYEKEENRFIFTFCYNTARILSKTELKTLENYIIKNMIDSKKLRSGIYNTNNRVQEFCTYRNLERDRELDSFIMQVIKENIAIYRNSTNINQNTCFYDFTICKNILACKTEIKSNLKPSDLQIDTTYNKKQCKEQNNATQHNLVEIEHLNRPNEENKYIKLIGVFFTRLRAYIKNNEQGYDDLSMNMDEKDIQKNSKNNYGNEFDVISNTEENKIENELQLINDDHDQKNIDNIKSKNTINENICQNKKIKFQEEKIDQEKISQVNDLNEDEKIHKHGIIDTNEINNLKDEPNYEIAIDNNLFCNLEKCKTSQFNDENKKDDKKVEHTKEYIIFKNQKNNESKISESDTNAERIEDVSSSILNDIKTYERSSDNFKNIRKQHKLKLDKNETKITEFDLNAEQLEDISSSVLHDLHELDQNSDLYLNVCNLNYKGDKVKNKEEQILQIEQNKKNILNACNEYKSENSNTNHLLNDIVNESNVLDFDYCSNQPKTSADIHKNYQKLITSNDSILKNGLEYEMCIEDNAFIERNNFKVKPDNIIAMRNKKNFKSRIPVFQRNRINLFDNAKNNVLTSIQEQKNTYTSTNKNLNSFSKIPIKKSHNSKKIIIIEKTTIKKEAVTKYSPNLQRYKINDNTSIDCLKQQNSHEISTKQNINDNKDKIPRKIYFMGKNNLDSDIKARIEKNNKGVVYNSKQNTIETKKRKNYTNKNQNKIENGIDIDLQQKKVYKASDNTNKVSSTHDRTNLPYQNLHTLPKIHKKREINNRQSNFKTDLKQSKNFATRLDRNIKHMDSIKTYSYKRLNIVDNATVIKPTHNLKEAYNERLDVYRKVIADTHLEYLLNKKHGETSIIAETIQNNSDRNVKHMDSIKTYSYKRLNIVDNATVIKPTHNAKEAYIERLDVKKKVIADTQLEYLRNKKHGESSVIAETIQNNFDQDNNELDENKIKKSEPVLINQKDKQMVNSVIYAIDFADKDKLIINKEPIETYELAENDKTDISDGIAQFDANHYNSFIENSLHYKHEGRIDKHFNDNFIDNNGLSNKIENKNYIKKEIYTTNTLKKESLTKLSNKNLDPRRSGRLNKSTDLHIKTNSQVSYDNKPFFDANLAYKNNKMYAEQSGIYIPNEKNSAAKDSTKITSYIPDQKEMIKNYIENRKNAEKYKTRFFERSNVTNNKEHKSFRNFYLGDFERGLRKQLYEPLKNKNKHSELNNNTLNSIKIQNIKERSSFYNTKQNIKYVKANQIAKHSNNVRKNKCGCRTEKKTLFEKREELRNKINIDKEAYKNNLYLKKEKSIESNNNNRMYTIFV
ncbi:hypothetical protein COBT_000677 [Conglomerata obtusa]